MFLFILLKRVKTAANPPPAHWVGQTHLFQMEFLGCIFLSWLSSGWGLPGGL